MLLICYMILKDVTIFFLYVMKKKFYFFAGNMECTVYLMEISTHNSCLQQKLVLFSRCAWAKVFNIRIKNVKNICI